MINRFILIFLLSFIYAGCAADPVKIEFPVTHPANPLAKESSFVPPPNPFMDREESSLIPQDSENSMLHKNMQTEQHEGHGMSKEPHKKSMKQSTDKHGQGEHN
jgi:hypothetical protein